MARLRRPVHAAHDDGVGEDVLHQLAGHRPGCGLLDLGEVEIEEGVEEGQDVVSGGEVCTVHHPCADRDKYKMRIERCVRVRVCVCVCVRERERERDVTSMHRVDFRNRREASRDAMARPIGPPSVRRQHSPMAASVAWLMTERELNQRVLPTADVECLK